MVWARNVLFLAVVGGGLFALAANLVPPRKPDRLARYDSRAYVDPAFCATIAHVDDSFRQQWQADSLTSADAAANLTVARRLSLGLMGTIPSLEEIRQFEALPPDQQIPWYIDHILADSRFKDYFAERLARSYVGTEDGPFILYRRRRFVNWLGEQIAANRPYDQIVRDLIASEGLWTDRPATNFVSVTVQQEMGNQPDPVRLAGRVTRAFLGLRLDCAQCHNHPFTDWKQADFQGLSAFFGQTHTGFRGINDAGGEYEAEDRYSKSKKIVEPKVPFAPELLPNDGTRRDRLATWVTHPQNPYFARAAVNRVWAIMCGKPLVDPVDNLEPGTPIPPALDVLADDFAKHQFDLRRLIRLIGMTDVFRRESKKHDGIGSGDEKAWAVFPLSRLRPEQVAGSVLQANSITTLDAETHIVIRLIRQGELNEFVQRYGDTGEDEFDGRGGTIPQRLLLMNGKMVRERIGQSPINATTRIALVSSTDDKAIEVAYLAVLSRRPAAREAEHFRAFLVDTSLNRTQKLEDLFWALLNSTEFSWNH